MLWPEIFLLSASFLAMLHVVGHPLVKMLERVRGFDQPIARLDFVQKLPLEFALAGALIYIWAIVATPFHLFNVVSSYMLLAIFASLYILQHHRAGSSRRSILASWKGLPKFSYLALGGFVFGLLLRVVPLANYVLGSIEDSALHTIFVYAVIRNAGIPLSAIPGSVLQVPQGVHVVMAYFSMVTGVPPELVVFYELAYFNATIILAAYTFCSLLVSREYAFIVTALVVGISAYPIVVTWGAQWIPWGLTIFFALFALAVPRFIDTADGTTGNLRALVAPGILLGYLGGTYPPLFAVSILVLFLMILMRRRGITRRVSYLVALIVVSLPLIALWVYRLYVFTNYTSPYILQQQNVSLYVTSYDASLRWLPYKEMLSLTGIPGAVYRWSAWELVTGWPGANTFFTDLIIIGVAVIILVSISKSSALLPSNLRRYLLGTFLAILIWGLDSPLGAVYSNSGILGIMASELDKLFVIAGTILIPFIAAVPIYLLLVLAERGATPSWATRKNVARGIVVVLVLANVVIIPPAIAWLSTNYGVYANSTNGDYELLQWMKTGIPSNASVLVNRYDAGQYVPSIAGKPTIGIASTIYFPDITYEMVWQMLADNVLNSTTISLLGMLNASYVYVGNYPHSGAWNAQLFLNHRFYFEMVKHFGSSYLFKVIVPDTRNLTTFGVVNNQGLIGVSDNRTMIDLQDMVMYNTITGSSKYFEIGLAQPNGSFAQVFSHSNPPQNVSLISENSTLVQIALSGPNGTAIVSAAPVLNQYTNLTIEYGGGLNTMLEFGIQPVTNVIQAQLKVGSMSNTTWSIGLAPRDASYFATSPIGSELAVTDQTMGLIAPGGGELSFSLTTLPAPPPNSTGGLLQNLG